jgi:Ca2+-transporting ATPase
MTKNWFQLSTEETLDQLDVKLPSGLSTGTATERLKKYGRNSIDVHKKISPLKLFFGQFKDILILILLASATVSLVLSLLVDGKDPGEAILIFIIVIAIAIIGFFNEYKAEKTVESLTKLVSYKTRVRRDGKIIEIPSTELVLGDIVLLDEGQKVPADIRLCVVKNLKINEASMTGEALPASKNTFALKEMKAIADQKNMAFAGTFISSGTAEGVVVATAMDTELGKIAELVAGAGSEPTPLQRKLDTLGKKLGIIITLICAVVFFIIVFFVDDEDRSSLDQVIFAFTAAVALAVAAIPEGLAFVVRISLALGARRMAVKNALVRKLSAVEALGSTDVICTDKTGTLTHGQMTVRELYVGGSSLQVSGEGYAKNGTISSGELDISKIKLQNLLRAGVLCNNSHVRGDEIIGDPTEAALHISAHKAGVITEAEQESYPRVNEFPFSSDRKRMTTVHKAGLGFYVAQKGATEIVIESCTQYQTPDGKVHPLTKEIKQKFLEANSEMAGRALRVLAVAEKTVKTQPKDAEEAEKGMTLLGLQAMIDPPRHEVVEVIHRVQMDSGIRVIMITGDNIETARAIGLKGTAMSGVDIDALSPEEFEKKIESVSVFARVNPEHKIRIVMALKKHGHQVAMTGDGVNDAPAIKAADIGIAMGITGTDAAKEAADIILLDDQFLTIISAIEEGRGIYDNVRKFVNFLLSTNIAEVLAILIGIILFQNLILTAAQILFTNILTDGIPAIALGADPAQKNILKAYPKRFQEQILTRRVWLEIIVFSVAMSAILLAMYAQIDASRGAIAATSAVFVGMVIFEKARLYDIRNSYHLRWYQNPWLSVTVFLTIFTQVALLYVPQFSEFMKVQPLAMSDWVVIIVGAVFLYFFMKALRPVFDRFELYAKNREKTVG